MSPSKCIIKTIDGREQVIAESMAEERTGPCFRCGFCCTLYRPPLHPEDIENIASTLRISTAEFISRYAERVATQESYLLQGTERGCVFLTWGENGKASCTIYPFRPKACREWTPSLSKPECLEGLAKTKSKGQIMLLDELLGSKEDKERLSLSLKNDYSPLLYT
ncbi:MAG: YkgJ family cysteine cluster protein [Dehalococcoidia bacterium]|nr:MAG: YkgJ family cysteine cluster protein [Dehalococcoidia bacterium]